MKKEILDEINRLLSDLEQDKHLPSDKEVDEEVKNVLEWLKGFVERQKEGWIDVKDSLPPMNKMAIVLTSQFEELPYFEIGFGHILSGTNLWDVRGVKYWIPCPELPEK